MVIFDQPQLKVFCKQVADIINSLTDRNINQSHIRELSARLTGRNTYAHLSSDLKVGPVTVPDFICDTGFSELLCRKHKLKFDDAQESKLIGFLMSQPLDMIPTPDINDAASGDTANLSEYLENTRAFLNANVPPLSDTEMAEAAVILGFKQLDFEDDPDEIVDECIYGLFIKQTTLTDESVEIEWDRELGQWRRDNRALIKRLKVYAQHAAFSANTALSQGANLGFMASKLRLIMMRVVSIITI